MSKTYRVWRRRTFVEYQDVEAESKEEARKIFVTPAVDWTVTDGGFITDCVVRTPGSKLQGEEMYLQMRVNQAKEMDNLIS